MAEIGASGQYLEGGIAFIKKKLRTIVIDNKIYLWRFMPVYEATGNAAEPWRCHDVFTAYLKASKLSPLHIHFSTWEDPLIGGPLRVGVPIIFGNAASGGVNLHTPRLAGELIRYARVAGWQPVMAQQPFLIKDGIKLLAEMGFGLSSTV